MQSDRSIFIQDAEIHLGGMQVDTTVKFMLLGVEIHEKASLVEVIKSYISILPQMMGRAIGGLLYYQGAARTCGQRGFLKHSLAAKLSI